jgi:hypothetical protein
LTAIQFQMTQAAEGQRTVTFVGEDGQFHSINSDTVGFDETLNAILINDLPTATAAAVPLGTIVARLAAVSSDFGTDGDVVTRHGVPLATRLSKMLLGYARNGSDALTALCLFIARLDNNPSKRSVENLYDWIEANGLTINAEGHIVAYKGVTNDSKSVHSGVAFVNGTKVEGQIPNAVGDVITMPRNQVQDDPSIGCHQGLHVGSHGYASSFGRRLLTVTIDPQDVVSVPTDCGAAKMRVCRYTVRAINEAKAEYAHYTVVDDYDEYGSDDYCDCPNCDGDH